MSLSIYLEDVAVIELPTLAVLLYESSSSLLPFPAM
jgi:hypothetical protein